MATPISTNRPINRWNHDSIRPGPVGPVGDVIAQVRLKQSMPESYPRWDKSFSGRAGMDMGSNVQDGQWVSFNTEGGGASVVDRAFINQHPQRSRHREFIHGHGNDTTRMEKVGSTGQYGWHNQIATTFNARVTGDSFLPEAGAYMLGEGDITRGGMFPRNDTGARNIKTEVLKEETTEDIIEREPDAAPAPTEKEVEEPEMTVDLPDDNLGPNKKPKKKRA